MTESSDPTAQYEQEHVHEVYQAIAPHFSATRYKPWPIVESFLQQLPPGSVGIDVGCGNGKYLPVNQNVFIIGSDRSANLVAIAARHAPHAAVVADSLYLPHPLGHFDFAISIAVIHHLSTPERRVAAKREVLEMLRPPGKGDLGGRALFFVWALEQKSSRRGWDATNEQDVMVPWVLKQKSPDNSSQPVAPDQTFQRYYHLYRKGELEDGIVSAGGTVVESGYDRDNWWAIATRKTQGV